MIFRAGTVVCGRKRGAVSWLSDYSPHSSTSVSASSTSTDSYHK